MGTLINITVKLPVNNPKINVKYMLELIISNAINKQLGVFFNFDRRRDTGPF